MATTPQTTAEKSAPAAPMTEEAKAAAFAAAKAASDAAAKDPRVEALIDYIMKNCLWQFHSRAWDRERQNREILGWAARELSAPTVRPEDRLERCHWADGVALARAWRLRNPWLATLAPAELTSLIEAVHARMDFLTITGSLNLELTDHQY